MGNSFFCERCDYEAFQVSRSCADHFFDEHGKRLTGDEMWLKRLECLDNAHSTQNGLTEEAFNKLVDRIEQIIKESENKIVYCRNREALAACLRQNPDCMLNCHREIEDFVGCVETIRINKIKKQTQTNMKKTRPDYESIFS